MSGDLAERLATKAAWLRAGQSVEALDRDLSEAAALQHARSPETKE